MGIQKTKIYRRITQVTAYCFAIVVSQMVVGCVSVQQQVAESEASQVEGFVGPLVVDDHKFQEVSSRIVYDRMKIDDQLLPSTGVTYEGTVGGAPVYIRNCKCLDNVRIVNDKLVIWHRYGGGEPNRESTYLLWNGKRYKNSKGELVVDAIIHSDKVDLRRALFQERKVLDIYDLRSEDANFVLINLLGYNGSIRYEY